MGVMPWCRRRPAWHERPFGRVGWNSRVAGRPPAHLDAGQYPTGVKVTKSQMDQIALIPDGFHGEWNYELLPR